MLFENCLVFSTFNESNAYQNLDKGPIVEDTILVLDPHTGSVLHSWGSYAFYMPHGLTVDHHDNVWVTDVAKHQVFKVSLCKSDLGYRSSGTFWPYSYRR